MPLSASERAFIERGISKGVRSDGRAAQSIRPLRITLNELPAAHGSARCSLGCGATEVLVSIKAELVCAPSASAPSLATPPPPPIECSAHLLAGSAAEAGLSDARGEAACASELAAALQALLGAPGAIPSEALQAVPGGRWSWRLAIDALVVASDGALLDVALLAAHAALRCARLPRLRRAKGAEGGGRPRSWSWMTPRAPHARCRFPTACPCA